jgi:hypothetical protein
MAMKPKFSINRVLIFYRSIPFFLLFFVCSDGHLMTVVEIHFKFQPGESLV